MKSRNDDCKLIAWRVAQLEIAAKEHASKNQSHTMETLAGAAEDFVRTVEQVGKRNRKK